MDKLQYQDLRAEPMQAKQALALAKTASKVYGYMGKKETVYDLKKDKPSDADLKKLIIGRSGTLRAPCLQVGKTFVGGYNEAKYKELLKL